MSTPERPRSFNSYTPRRLRAYGRGHSRFVAVLKVTLLLAAVALVGVLVARLAGDPQQLADLPQEEKTTPGQIELVQAKYEGVDGEGRPYTLTADKAIRVMNAPDTVLFENPVADITLQDKTWIVVRGKSGTFDRTTEMLSLKDEVTVFHDSGYEIQVQDLLIDLKQQTAASALPVRAQGPMGTITAQNMSVENQGNLVVFGGPATMTIFKLSSRKIPG